MTGEVQALVDALAAELQKPVGVDDQQFRAVAYSSHSDGVDAVRRASILQRRAPDEVTEWLESLGVRRARSAVHVPAHDEFEMTARVCQPLWFDDALLGYLWLINEPDPLSPAELEAIGEFAEQLGVALYRVRVLERDERERQRELLAQLLGRRPGDASAAATELHDEAHLVAAPGYAALVLRSVGGGGGKAPDGVVIRITDAAEQLRRTVPPRQLLVLADGGDAIVVLACISPSEVDRRAAALAVAGAEHLAGAAEWSPLVGVGEVRASLAEIGRSYAEAIVAAQAAAACGATDPVVRWADMGANRTVAELLGDRDPGAFLPPTFLRLLESADGATLVPTLEHYLDRGGDARAAAEALFLHRSSLYGRLHRIEELAGVDLHSGDDRLELHLALRLWRLSEGGGAG